MVMNLILWLIVGGVLGWIASKIMRTDAQQGIVLNIIVGVIGALLAGLLLTPLFSARRMVKEYVERFYVPAARGTLLR